MSGLIISDDGFWQLVNGEWIPTEKQTLAIENGAIPYDPDNQEDTRPYQRKKEINQCANCGGSFEGRAARKCPKRGCRNPICLTCDPLQEETSAEKSWKIFEKFEKILDFLSGDFTSLTKNIMEDEVEKHTSRIRCKSCLENDRRHDIVLISVTFSIILGIPIASSLIDYLSVNAFVLFLIIFSISYLLVSRIVKLVFVKLDATVKTWKSVRNTKATLVAVTILSLLIVAMWPHESANYEDEEIVGEWSNISETLDFREDGKLESEISNTESWRTNGQYLVLKFESDEDMEYYYAFKVQEEFLFIAPYEEDLKTISDENCYVYSSHQNATEESYWETNDIEAPQWCNLEN